MAFRNGIGEIIFQTLNYCCLKQGTRGDRLRLAEKRQKNLEAPTFEETFPRKRTTVVSQKSPFIFGEGEGKALFFFLVALSSFDGNGVTFPRNPSHNKAKHRIERET